MTLGNAPRQSHCGYISAKSIWLILNLGLCAGAPNVPRPRREPAFEADECAESSLLLFQFGQRDFECIAVFRLVLPNFFEPLSRRRVASLLCLLSKFAVHRLVLIGFALDRVFSDCRHPFPPVRQPLPPPQSAQSAPFWRCSRTNPQAPCSRLGELAAHTKGISRMQMPHHAWRLTD